MDQTTIGTVTAVSKQWWMKINNKPVRIGALDGAVFPHIIKVTYSINGKAYTQRKWINAGLPIPKIGSNVQVQYCADKPSKAKIL